MCKCVHVCVHLCTCVCVREGVKVCVSVQHQQVERSAFLRARDSTLLSLHRAELCRVDLGGDATAMGEYIITG